MLCLGRNDWCSRSLKKYFKLESSRIRPAWAASCFTDQLTPWFSGGSIINGTPGVDRWARVLGGREFSVGRLAGCRSPFIESTLTALGLSQPEVVCTNLKIHANSWKTRNATAPQTHHDIPPNPKHTTISHRTPNTPRNPQQPGDRDHLETACDETTGQNDECYTYTDRQTN